MGLGELSYGAVVSLKAIDEWISTINANMAGSGRVGFRANRVKFAGGATTIQRGVNSPMLGVQFAEQSLFSTETSLDFSQGAVVASTEPTHFALQQIGNTANVPFFAVQETTTAAGGTTATGSEFYTRDGEFHFDTQANPVLRTSDGLAVKKVGGAGFVTLADVTNGAINLNAFKISSSVSPNIELRFSRFGSTVFETVSGAALATSTAPNAFGDFAGGRLIPQSLEASNASLSQSVPELALAQKMYAAISKVISVTLSNVDVALGLIR